jgi:hypothetical protein
LNNLVVRGRGRVVSIWAVSGPLYFSILFFFFSYFVVIDFDLGSPRPSTQSMLKEFL